MDQIFGYVERITYQNPENGFTVAQLQRPRDPNLTCIVGTMPGLQPGETLHCQGKWNTHIVHGKQFLVEKSEVRAPADLNGIEKYLGSGLIKGIGHVYAKKIVTTFGVETLSIIDTDPMRLCEVDGLGKKRVEKIVTCWAEQKSIREVMIFLQAHGVSPTYAQKIFKRYGKKSITVVQENPYALATDIFGIGFKSADKIAYKLGISKDSPKRIDAGIEFVLSELSSDGHACYPVPPFLLEAAQMLEVDVSLIEERISSLKQEKRVIIDELVDEGSLEQFIWIPPLYYSETGIAREIQRLLTGKSPLRDVQVDSALQWVENQLKITLGGNQRSAVACSLKEKFQIITGGPGTGKSTITNAILTITQKLTGKILLAAPTGRAAKRMTEITKKKASTIHSLLEVNIHGGGFKKNKDSPLDCDLIIIDEASMIDTVLMYSLLRAIPSHARVIFVGDINQLPSVGPGNVLKDIIDSKTVNVTMLNDIYRQASGSQIVTNAHMIHAGLSPKITNQQNGDFFFIDCQEPEEILQQIVGLVTHRLPKNYRFDPLDDIQILCPMKRGVLGTENINEVLQKKLNPNSQSITRYGRQLAINDKVMQIRNNYDKKIYNGDIGRVKAISEEEQKVWIQFDENQVEFTFSDLDEVILAYAVSIHKSQGSEYPCVVIPIHTSHFKLLHRNLLYTGVTRGKQLVILVGSRKAVGIAVRNDEVKKRYTALEQALIETQQKAPKFL